MGICPDIWMFDPWLWLETLGTGRNKLPRLGDLLASAFFTTVAPDWALEFIWAYTLFRSVYLICTLIGWYCFEWEDANGWLLTVSWGWGSQLVRLVMLSKSPEWTLFKSVGIARLSVSLRCCLWTGIVEVNGFSSFTMILSGSILFPEVYTAGSTVCGFDPLWGILTTPIMLSFMTSSKVFLPSPSSAIVFLLMIRELFACVSAFSWIDVNCTFLPLDFMSSVFILSFLIFMLSLTDGSNNSMIFEQVISLSRS